MDEKSGVYRTEKLQLGPLDPLAMGNTKKNQSWTTMTPEKKSKVCWWYKSWSWFVSSTHHHHPSPPLLQILLVIIAVLPTGAPAHVVSLVHGCVRMPFTEIASAQLVVIIPQNYATCEAREASRVELQPLVRFKILALNASVARPAKRPIKRVVMLVAVGRVLEYVKFGRGEWVTACATHKALLVIATCESPRRILDRFSNNWLTAPPTPAFARS